MINENAYSKVIAEGMGIEWVMGELKGFTRSRFVANQAIAKAGNPEIQPVRVSAVFSYRKNAAGEKRIGGNGSRRAYTGLRADSIFFRGFAGFEANKFGQTGTQKAAGGALVESQPAAVAANPQAILAINQQAPDEIIGERSRVLRVVIVVSKGRGGRVEARKATAHCPCPDEALAVAGQGEDPVAAEGTGISRVMAEIFDTEAVSIEDIDPGAIGSNVEEAGVSLIKRANFRMREAGLIERVR